MVVIMRLKLVVLGPGMPVDRFFEKGDKELGAKAEEASDQLYSMRKRMSMFPRVDTETSEPGNMGFPNLFPQNEGSSPALGIGCELDGIFSSTSSLICCPLENFCYPETVSASVTLDYWLLLVKQCLILVA